MAAIEGPSRRQVIQTTGVVGAVALVTAACGGASNSTAGPAGAGPAVTSPTPAATSPTPAASSTGGAVAGTTLGPASDVAVGGGKVYETEKVVVTQPTAGTYEAFNATCTHQGCLVNEVTNGTINCPCHQSQFSITDGSVVSGLAPSALAKVNVAVTGGNVVLTT